MVLSYFRGGSTPVKSDPEASDKEAVPTPDSAQSEVEEVPQVQLLWTKNGLMDPKSGHMVTVPAPTKDADMTACYEMLETVASSELGLAIMTSLMATRSPSTPTKPSPVQDRARTIRFSPVEHASSPATQMIPPYPGHKYTRPHEWNVETSKEVFAKFKTDYEGLHGPIGDVVFNHFKLLYSSWVQNSRERGRFEAFEYALDVAELAYEGLLSIEDRNWIVFRRKKIVQLSLNQVQRNEILKRKRSNS